MTAFQNHLGVEEIRNQTEDVSSIAEQFHKLYYESIDSKRHLMARLYMETAMLVWNGNPFQNMPEIQKFYEQLPTTTHSVHCVDSQLLSSHAVGAQKTLLIQTAGKSRLHEGTDKSFKPFQQTFIVTAQGDKWKIVSDIYRQQMPLESFGLSQQEQQLKQLQFQQQQIQQQQQLQQFQSQQPIPPQQFQQQQQQQFYPPQTPQFAEQPQLFQQQQLEQQQLQLLQQQQLQQQQQMQQQLQQQQLQQQQFQQQQNPQFVPTGFKF